MFIILFQCHNNKVFCDTCRLIDFYYHVIIQHTPTHTISRPPGHHAECAFAMGFSLFNSVAIAAKYAVKKLGLKR